MGGLENKWSIEYGLSRTYWLGFFIYGKRDEIQFNYVILQ